MDLTLVYILAILFVATLVRSTFGFGESLIAVPLLGLFLPMDIAVPLSVLVSIFVAAFVVVQDRRQIHFQSAKWLILFAMIGIPLGIWLLDAGDERWIKGILGLIIMLYSVYSLRYRSGFKLHSDHRLWLFICGFLSGILGGAYGVNGPPLVLYGNLRGWSAKQFRATLQAYFLPASIAGMLGYWFLGLWNWDVSYYFLISLPVTVPAILLGRFFNHRLKDGHFLRYIFMALIVIGMVLSLQALFLK